MTQSLFTAMTGLNAGTNQLTVVSDNVANMNTTAYKTSRVDFQDIWYQTKSGGTNSTAYTGGTNPYQIGVGVKSAAITKNMDASSINTTGRSEDMAIQGDGWFTVVNSDGQVLYTRDGNFSLDEEGYVCTSAGYKVIGMDEMQAETCSNIPLRVPNAIDVIEKPTDAGMLKTMSVDKLNNCSLVGGTIHFKVDGGEDPVEFDIGGITSATTVQDLLGKLNTDNDYFTASVDKAGVMTFTAKDGHTIEFVQGGSSNLVKQLNLSSQGSFTDSIDSDTMNISATISESVDPTADTSHIKKSWNVGVDGLLTVNYSDGSSLSVKAGDDGKTYFSYTNANGVVINSHPQTAKDKESLYVDPNVLVKANMQVQLAKFVNNNGLVAAGNNCYENGVNAGDVLYTTANHNGVGGIATGALESSNVDLAQQFSNMILAQRLVQANSQVFSSANSMLETLVYLGRG